MTMAETAQYLRDNDGYLILTHERPDGDTLGSAAGLCMGLRALGKRAFVARNPQAEEGRFGPMVSPLAPQNGDLPEPVVVTVDTAAPSLLPEVFSEYIDNVSLSIDHHPGGGAYSKHSLVDTSCGAAGELVYLLLRELGVAVDKDIAEPLYVAITTDTGCLRFECTTSRTLRVVADLKDTGLQTAAINSRLFEQKTFSRMALEASLFEDAKLLTGGDVCLMRLTLEKQRRVKATHDDMDGLASLSRQILGVEIGVLMTQESEDTTKVSLRTGTDFSAREICMRMGGGGHPRAAGCMLKMPFEDAFGVVLDAVRAVYLESGRIWSE